MDKAFWIKEVQEAEECLEELSADSSAPANRRELAIQLLILDRLDSILARLPL